MHMDEITMDPFTRRHIGRHGAFTHRTNERHLAISRAAVAHRLDVPVGSIEVQWAWNETAKVVPIKRRAAA